MGAHIERGRLLYHQGRYDEALEELGEALAEDPQSSEGHAFYALSLSELERADEAVAAARRAVESDPDHAFPHFVHAKVLYEFDRNDEATHAIAEALRIDPEEPSYYALSAALRLDGGNARGAIRMAERGLAVNPEHVGCLNLRSMALTQLGRRAEAQQGLDAALAADPDSALSHANRGWTYLHSADAKQALAHFSEALRLDPTNEWARSGLIEALKARNLIYRAVLTWYLFSARLSTRARWALVLGIMFGARVLRKTLQSYEHLAPLAVLVGLAYLSIIYLSWVAVPLFNLMLFLDKLGRHALSREQRSSALAFGASLLLAVGVAAVSLGFGFSSEAAVLGAAGLALGIPVASVSSMRAGKRRAFGIGFVALGAGALLFAAMLKPIGLDPEHTLPVSIGAMTILACLLSTWVISLSGSD